MFKTHRILAVSREFFWVIFIPTIIVLNVAFLLRTLELYLTPTVNAASPLETQERYLPHWRDGYVSPWDARQNTDQNMYESGTTEPLLTATSQVLGVSTDSAGYKALKTSQNYDLVNIAPGSGF